MQYRLLQIADGHEREGLRESGQKKSISREHTFLTDSTDADEILGNIHQMILSLCYELEDQSMYSRTIGIRIRYPRFITKTKSVTLMQPTRDVRAIEKAVDGLFAEMWALEPVRLIGVRCSGLVYLGPVQRTLHDFIPDDMT